MAFNINDFHATVSKHGGINTTNRFLVYIAPPKWYQQQQTDEIAPVLQFFCEGANIPSLSIAAADYKPQNFGRTVKRPMSMNFGPLNTSFFCDADGRVIGYFHRWIQEIINYSSASKGELASYGNLTSYEIAYPDQYQTTITLLHFSAEDQNVYTQYDFYECFPIQTGDIQLAWEQNDSIAKLPVEFSYSFYTQFKDKLPFPVTSGDARGIGFFERAAQLGSIYGVLSNVRKPKSIQDAINIYQNVQLLF